MSFDKDIVGKIKKLLALADQTRNKNIAEAESAALKAQELLAKYGISHLDISEEDKEIINYDGIDVGTGKSWKYALSNLVARNFRCKCFWYERRFLGFYGYETDVKVCIEIFHFLFKNIHKMADREVHRRYSKNLPVKGTYKSFVVGFMRGLSDKLDSQCEKLMLYIPQEVITSYEEFSSTFKTKDLNKNITIEDKKAFDNGYYEGYHIMERRELSCSNY